MARSAAGGVEGLLGPISFLDIFMKNLKNLVLVLMKNVVILLSLDPAIRKPCLKTCETKEKFCTRFSIY